MLILPEQHQPEQSPPSEWSAWDRDRPVNYPIFEERDHYLCTVHGFDAGGFEAVVREVDVQAMVDARMRPRGLRKPVEQRDGRDMVRAVARARKTIRHAVKMIGANHLLTMTTRENENTPEGLACQWKKFVRSYRVLSGSEFPYVAVPERHPKNPKHWHLHVAIAGWLKLKIARQIWWHCCGGRGEGNVDVQRIKVGVDRFTGEERGPLVKSEKIARYISKYMSKDLIFAHRPDKKRYWRSEFDLPDARRYWLKSRPGGADGLSVALREVLERFGLTGAGLSCFFFPDGSGVWLSYNPHASAGQSAQPPPF